MEIIENKKGGFIIFLTLDETARLKELCPEGSSNKARTLRDLLRETLVKDRPKTEVIMAGLEPKPERT